MATKLREVKIEEYWPLIVKNTAEFGQIAVAENPEFNNLAECIYRVLCDSFIDADMTEYGVSRWEKMLGITPAEGSSLDDRKAAILTQLSVKIPYTWRVLKQMLVPILGGEDKFVMEYVNDEGKLVVHTDRLDDAMLDTVSDLLERVLPQNIEVVQYNHHIEVSWRDINKYAECVTVEDMLAVNPDYKNDLTSDGGWIWPLNSLKKATELFRNFVSKNLHYIDFYAPELTSANSAFRDIQRYNPYTDEIVAYMPKCKLGYTLAFCGGWWKKLKVTISPETTSLYYEFNGNPRLEDFEINDLPKLSIISNGFAGTQLNKKSILRLLNQLPTWTSGTHDATIGIHIDHKYDPEVNLALKKADINYEPTIKLTEEVTEGKGWTVNVQWNGTPTSTTTTFDRGTTIYAKVSEIEHPDGTTERMLDWGHYVTDWEARGYEQFRSLESAYKYFNLEMPENE